MENFLFLEWMVFNVSFFILIFFWSTGPLGEGLSCTVVGIGIWGTTIFAVRNLLKLLFQYKGYMYEQRGRGRSVSLATRLWYMAVKLFSGWNRPMLYSFQGSLPSLPLPRLDDTMQRVCLMLILKLKCELSLWIKNVNFLIFLVSSICEATSWRWRLSEAWEACERV